MTLTWSLHRRFICCPVGILKPPGGITGFGLDSRDEEPPSDKSFSFLFNGSFIGLKCGLFSSPVIEAMIDRRRFRGFIFWNCVWNSGSSPEATLMFSSACMCSGILRWGVVRNWVGTFSTVPVLRRFTSSLCRRIKSAYCWCSFSSASLSLSSLFWLANGSSRWLVVGLICDLSKDSCCAISKEDGDLGGVLLSPYVE